MPDETESNPPPEQPSQPGGAYSQGEKISKINVADEIKNSFLDYSISVIISRALPDVRDGLKPSQRRILYAMNDLGVQPNRKHLKCAKIVGETMGNYHPHGDQAIYTGTKNCWPKATLQNLNTTLQKPETARLRLRYQRLRHLSGLHLEPYGELR